MFGIILFFLLIFSHSEVRICISESEQCGNMNSDDIFVVFYNDPNLFKNIRNYIGRDKTIEIYFNTLMPNIGDFELPLALFIDRNIIMLSNSSINAPNTIIFTYLDSENYSSTSFTNFGYYVKFKYIGQLKALINLQFDIFAYKYAAKSILIPNIQNVNLICNMIFCVTDALTSFEECYVLNTTNNINIIAVGDVNITVCPNNFIISSESKDVMIKNEDKAEISIQQYNDETVVHVISKDIITDSDLSTISINYVRKLIFSGTWPNSDINNYREIRGSIRNILSTEIEIKSPCLPFDIILSYGANLDLSLYSHFTLLGKLICDSKTQFHKMNSSIDIINVYMKSVDSIIDVNVPEINLTIELYKHIFNVDRSFPIAFAFNNKYISHVKIIELDFSGLVEFIKNYNFKNLMDYQPTDEEVGFLLNEKKPFFQMPDEVIYFYWSCNSIQYLKDSNPIMGLGPVTNSLNLDIKVDSNAHVIRIATYGPPLSDTEISFCIGNGCMLVGSTSVAYPADLSLVFTFGASFKKYLFMIIGNENEIEIGLHNLPYKDLQLKFSLFPMIVPQGVRFKFPNNNETIESCLIDLSKKTQLVGDTKFVAKKLSFENIIYNETVMNEFDCDDITTDYMSLKTLMNTDFIENMTVNFVPYNMLTSPVPIFVTDDKIVINTTDVMWSKVGNLTLIGNLFDVIVNSSAKIHEFHIACAADPSEISIDGNLEDEIIKNSIHIHANGFKTILNIKKPFNYGVLNLHDKGKFSIKYSYSDVAKICVYKEQEYCIIPFDRSIQIDNFSEIESIVADNLEIEFFDFFDQSDSVSLDLSILQAKQVKFTSSINSNFKMVVSPPSGNQDLTEFIFQNLVLEINTTEEIVKFNYLSLSSCSIHSSAEILEVNSLTCAFNNLVGWEKVFITDSLSVSGEFPSENFTVIMLNEIKDFALTIDFPLRPFETVTFGENMIKLHDGFFIFSENHHGIPVRLNLDIAFIYFEFLKEAKSVPKCSISAGEISVVSFIGNWSQTSHYFQILLNGSIMIFNRDFLRCDILGVGTITYNACSLLSGIIGTIDVTPAEFTNDIKPTVEFTNELNTTNRTKIVITDIIINFNYDARYPSPFKFLKPNIDLEITKIRSNGGDKISYHHLELPLFEEGIPTITFKSLGDFYLVKEIRISINIEGWLKDNDAYDILKQNYTIIKGPVRFTSNQMTNISKMALI